MSMQSFYNNQGKKQTKKRNGCPLKIFFFQITKPKSERAKLDECLMISLGNSALFDKRNEQEHCCGRHSSAKHLANISKYSLNKQML